MLNDESTITSVSAYTHCLDVVVIAFTRRRRRHFTLHRLLMLLLLHALSTDLGRSHMSHKIQEAHLSLGLSLTLKVIQGR